MAESLDWLLHRSHSTPLLTAEQEIHLARQVQAWLPLRDKESLTVQERAICRRGKRAWDTFYLANIRLVVVIAKRFVKRAQPHLTMEDLVQEGMVGLERAITKYDPSRGYKFSTYSFNWIRQSINRAIENTGRMIRLPSHSLMLLRKANTFCDQYHERNGRQPRMAEIAAELGCNMDTLKAVLGHSNNVMSLDQKVRGGDEGLSAYIELLADDPTEENYLEELSDLAALLPDLIAHLSDIERYIIEQRYMTSNKVTLAQIGQQLGTSREAIRQRHNRAMNKLRYQLSKATVQTDIPAQQCAA